MAHKPTRFQVSEQVKSTGWRKLPLAITGYCAVAARFPFKRRCQRRRLPLAVLQSGLWTIQARKLRVATRHMTTLSWNSVAVIAERVFRQRAWYWSMLMTLVKESVTSDCFIPQFWSRITAGTSERFNATSFNADAYIWELLSSTVEVHLPSPESIWYKKLSKSTSNNLVCIQAYI